MPLSCFLKKSLYTAEPPDKSATHHLMWDLPCLSGLNWRVLYPLMNSLPPAQKQSLGKSSGLKVTDSRVLQRSLTLNWTWPTVFFQLNSRRAVVTLEKTGIFEKLAPSFSSNKWLKMVLANVMHVDQSHCVPGCFFVAVAVDPKKHWDHTHTHIHTLLHSRGTSPYPIHLFTWFCEADWLEKSHMDTGRTYRIGHGTLALIFTAYLK